MNLEQIKIISARISTNLLWMSQPAKPLNLIVFNSFSLFIFVEKGVFNQKSYFLAQIRFSAKMKKL